MDLLCDKRFFYDIFYSVQQLHPLQPVYACVWLVVPVNLHSSFSIPILHFSDIPLYSDFLHDHGEMKLDVKVC